MVKKVLSVEGCDTVVDVGYWIAIRLRDAIQRAIVATRMPFSRCRLGKHMLRGSLLLPDAGIFWNSA